MKNAIIAVVLAPLSVIALAGARGAASQPPNPAPPTPSASAQEPATTLVGCLYREDQIPGRKPNVAERAGVLEDYILADASVAGAKAKPGAAESATGTAGSSPKTGSMYKVEGPSDERLKALVGKRVEVTGRIDPEGGPDAKPGTPRPDRGLGPDEINLPEFEASAIKEISGTCPATPARK